MANRVRCTARPFTSLVLAGAATFGGAGLILGASNTAGPVASVRSALPPGAVRDAFADTCGGLADLSISAALATYPPTAIRTALAYTAVGHAHADTVPVALLAFVAAYPASTTTSIRPALLVGAVRRAACTVVAHLAGSAAGFTTLDEGTDAGLSHGFADLVIAASRSTSAAAAVRSTFLAFAVWDAMVFVSVCIAIDVAITIDIGITIAINISINVTIAVGVSVSVSVWCRFVGACGIPRPLPELGLAASG